MEMEGGCDSAAAADATSTTDGSTVTTKPLQNFNQAVIQNTTIVTPYKYHKCVVIPEVEENQENIDPIYTSSPENVQQMLTLSSSLGTPSSGPNNTSTTSSFQSPIITPKLNNNEDVSEGNDSSPFAYPLIWEHHHPVNHNTMLLTMARSPRTHRTPSHPSPAKALVYGDSPNQEPLSTYKGNTRTPSKYTKSPSERSIFLTPSSRFARDHRLGTTPSRRAAYNPFDVDIDELHLPVVSPSLFKNVVSPSEKVDENFHWSIDQLAVLKPASIDDSPLLQQELYIDAAHCDKRAQEGIEKFFRATNIVPSPWPSSSSSNSHRPINLLHQLGTPSLASAAKMKPTGQSVWCQTEITLPPVLPPELEAALKPFCTFTQDQWWQGEDEDNSMLNNTTLRRKLLFGQEEPSSSPQVVTVCEVSTDSLDESCSKIFSPVCSDEIDKVELMWCASPVACGGIASANGFGGSTSPNGFGPAHMLDDLSPVNRPLAPDLSPIACGGTVTANGFGRSASPNGFGPTHMLEDLSPVNRPFAPDLSPIRPEFPNLSPIQDYEKRKSPKHISPLSSVRTSPITVPVNRDKSEIRKCISPGLSPVHHFEYYSSKNNSSLLMKTNNATPHEVCGVYRLQKCSTSTSPNNYKQKSQACRAVLNEEKCRSPLGSSMYSGSNSSSIMHTTCTSLSSSNSISSCSMVGINPVISSSSSNNSNSSAPCSSAVSSLYFTPREWQSTAWSLEEVKETPVVDSPDVPPAQTITPQSNTHSTGSGHFSSSPIRNLSSLSPNDSQSPQAILSPGVKFAASPPVSPILCRSLMGRSTVQVNNNGITRSSSESQHAMSIIAGESMCSTDDIMEDVEEGNVVPGATTNNGRWWLEEHCSRASFQTLKRTNSTIDMDTDSQPFLEGSNTEGTFQDTGYQTGSIHCTNYSLAGHENNSGSTCNYTQTTKSKAPTSTNGSHITNTGTQVTTNSVILSEFSFPQVWPAQ